MTSPTYKNSGVNIESGYEVMNRAKKAARLTRIPGVIGDIGLFGGCFQINKNQVLVSGTDGVGTKLKLAFDMGRHDTVGIDLVAMNADDVVTCGAKPLFFLDYIGCHKVDPKILGEVLLGIAEGCKQAGCALIGGETAELSDMYKAGEYDLAGFAVGVVDKKNLIDGSKVKEGDVILGLGSSGLHSNGFTLARNIVFNIAKLKVNSKVEGLSRSIGEELLTPTRIYARSLLKLLDKVKVRAIAHITGGGLPENVARVVPKGLSAQIERSSWKPNPIFKVLQKLGDVSDNEMLKAFNMGIGMIVVVAKKDAKKASIILSKSGEKVFVIGRIKNGKDKVEIL
ncbi:phosphoribosylformylglycinamidine cyclo-ligase [Candidatus Saganbacteria bacterium]|nr:phosphoribosylformylglycinamidine cyclo-ligase [Candidatus Saganbacteria bacterium]